MRIKNKDRWMGASMDLTMNGVNELLVKPFLGYFNPISHVTQTHR